MHNKAWSKTQLLTLTGIFSGIIFLLTFTPIGFIQIPLIGSATIMHIPVIVGAIIMGPKYGAILGFMFGLSSLVFATTFSVALNAFAFTPFRNVPGTAYGSPWALLIAFVPRILVGIIPPLVFYGIMKILPAKAQDKKFQAIGISIASVAGSMTNTLLVLNLMYFIFREPWSLAREGAGVAGYQITYAFIAGIIGSMGVAEAITAAVVVPAVCLALFAVAQRMPKRHQAA